MAKKSEPKAKFAKHPRVYGHGARPMPGWISKTFLRKAQDRFGYMFPGLARRRTCVAPFTAQLRQKMEDLGHIIGSKDSGNLDNPRIPAGYTYLGQFIDHDITFDPLSDFDQQTRPRDVQNFRTPSLDLDSVYGRGPSIDPYLYDQASGGFKLRLGENRNTGNGGPDNSPNPPTDFDVPRTGGPDFTALIGDPRNDENLIVSQLHHAFLKFHNAVFDMTGGPFERVRQTVTLHYQWIVAHDFLKTIVDNDTLVDDRIANGPRFFRRRPFRMPVEFAVGAYRFGHSMIRDRYGVNDNFPHATLAQVFEFVRVPRRPVLSNWVVDFNRFFNTGSPKPLNLTRQIDTRLAAGLEALPDEMNALFASLAARNLRRGLSFGLPSGQCVARRIGVTPLTPAQIRQGGTTAEKLLLRGSRLSQRTPLWYYILKEAEVKKGGGSLGPVGATIIVDTFARILHDDPDSFVHKPGFAPTLPANVSGGAGDFKLVDLLDLAGVL